MVTLATHAIQTFSADTVSLAANRVANTWQWYIVRGAGFTAAFLLVCLMLSGIGQVTGLTYRVLEPVKAWAVHKALGLALAAAIVIHVAFLLVDKAMPFSLTQVLVPFTANYTNGSTLLGIRLGVWGIALGILAAYSVIVVVLTSLTWIDTKQRTWRWLHYLNYFTITAVFVHSLSVGSDLKYGTFRAAWAALAGVVILAIFSRLLRAGTIKRSKSPTS